MKTLALVMALVACAGANAETVPGVRPAEPKPVMIVPPALAAAAEAPSVRIAPEGDSAEESAAPEAGLREGDVADAAVARAQEFPESAAAQAAEAGDCPLDGAPQVADAEADAPAFGEAVPDGTDEMGPPAVFGCARSVRESEPRKVETLPEPKSDSDCTFAGVYAKRRTLSGPWSASRRLQAARIRGDGDEAKRMETMLDDLRHEGAGRRGGGIRKMIKAIITGVATVVAALVGYFLSDGFRERQAQKQRDRIAAEKL